ncbi:MAG: hypothetical protein V4569_04470 [Pseudomonadota bacterium]
MSDSTPDCVVTLVLSSMQTLTLQEREEMNRRFGHITLARLVDAGLKLSKVGAIRKSLESITSEPAADL